MITIMTTKDMSTTTTRPRQNKLNDKGLVPIELLPFFAPMTKPARFSKWVGFFYAYSIIPESA